jgi:tyrosine-protein phosphatase SIW14
MVVFTAVLATFLILSAPQAAWAGDKQDGLPNFGHVTDNLFRGAQPSGAGFSALHDMGVSIVVDFRQEPGKIAAEQSQVEGLGMKFVSIPWSGHDDPSNAQVAQFLDLVRANPNAKIFVHCRAGKDRTGVMVAAYRIAMERKSVSEAVEEMHQYRYHELTLPHLKRYVKTLPALLESEKVFSAYAPTAPSIVPPGAPTVVPAAATVAEAPAAPAAAPAAEPATAPTSPAPAALTPAARPAAQ